MNYTAEQFEQAKVALEAGETPSAFAHRMAGKWGRSFHAVRHFAADVKTGRRSAPIPLGEKDSAQPEEESLARLGRGLYRAREEVKLLRAQLNAQTAANIGREAVIAAIRETVTPLPEIKPLPLPRQGTRRRRQGACLVLGDWHAMEVVRPERVNGINAFDHEILAGRVWLLLEKVRSLIDDMRKAYAIDVLHVFILGDMVSGNIHKLPQTNEVNMHVAAAWTGALLGQLLWRLAEMIDLEVRAVAGNHTRTDPAGIDPKDPTDNFDWTAYEHARAHLAKLIERGRVEWGPCERWTAEAVIEGKRIVAAHGDEVRGQFGLPFYGLMRALARRQEEQRIIDRMALDAKQDLRALGIDIAVIGHFHQSAYIGQYFLNGSLKGYDEYAMKYGYSPVPPKQWFFRVDHDWGACGMEEIVVKSVEREHGWSLPAVLMARAA